MSIRGAEFRKTDLQIHSPRDGNWGGLRPEDKLGADATPEQIQQVREEFCEALINKCITEGLRAIAITDHHEGIYSYIAIHTKEKMERDQEKIDLWIFPGMELTCKDSCQALIIFDANLPQSLFEKARSKLGLPTDCAPLSSKGIKVELLNYNIVDLQSILEGDDELRDRFIIFPHVKPEGHKTVLRMGFHMRFRDMPYVGGYMDKCYPDQLSEGDRRILDGEIPAWSSEKRGVICSSDARHADFTLIGQHASWIKLASPTAESLRQAMLAPDSRIRYEKPKLPSVVITKMTVQGANYIQNGEYVFNQQMNSIIGGRGAGKSSLLEYIRFALGCSAMDGKDAAHNGKARATLRMMEMLQNTLTQDEGVVTVDILLNGAPIKLSRTIANPKFINVENNGEISKSTADDIVKLIPVQPFRQGELSDFAREELANRLLELVTANASDKIEELELGLKNNGQQLSEALAKAVLLTAARQKKAHYETELKLFKSQIESLQRQLTTTIVDQTGDAITNHEKYHDEQRNIESVSETIREANMSINKELSNLMESLTRLANNRPILDLGELGSYYAHIADLLHQGKEKEAHEETISALDVQISTFFESRIALLAEAEKGWQVQLEKHEIEYQEQKIAFIGQQNLLVSMEELNSKIKRASEDHEKAVTDEQEFRTAEKELEDLRTIRRQLHDHLVEIVNQQVATIYEKSSQLARGELSNNWDFREIEDAIKSVLDLPQIREKRIEDAINLVKSAENPLAKWEEILDEMLALVKWKEGAYSSEENQPPTTPLLLQVLDTSFLAKLYSFISSDRVASALRAVIRPRVDIYQKRQGGEIEFRKASQGEQAATLLNILMNQSRGPLIIDQPEEDLDNKIINDIVKTIHRTKDDRQLIISTHNANIAVNGDSELVIEMYLGKNNASGAIDETSIRDGITSTMEGGKDAFELRRKKYNF